MFTANASVVLLAEHALFAHFATNYRFVSPSGFEASVNALQAIVEHANAIEPQLLKIVNFQTG